MVSEAGLKTIRFTIIGLFIYSAEIFCSAEFFCFAEIFCLAEFSCSDFLQNRKIRLKIPAHMEKVSGGSQDGCSLKIPKVPDPLDPIDPAHHNQPDQPIPTGRERHLGGPSGA